MRYSDGFGFSVGSRKHSPEYRFVSRFRQRRLLSLLSRQRLYDTFNAFIGESNAFMYPGHLTALATEGRWEQAIEYISRFLPSDRRLGVHGRALIHFLRVHKAIDAIVAGAPESHAVSAALNVCFTLKIVRSQGITKLRAILWSLLCYKESRETLDLGRLRDKAASIIDDLAWQTPELKQYMTYARGPMKPHHVLPIGFGFRPRRHVKRGPIPRSVLVRHYLRKRSMFPSSTSSPCEVLSFASLIKAKGWMVDLVDTSLKAGKINQGCPLQSVSNKGAPVGSVSQTNVGTLRSPATHSGMSSDTDIELMVKEWAVYLTDDRLEAWPDMSQGYPPIRRSVDKDVARVSEAIPDTLTRLAKSSAIPSLTKEDAPVLHTLKDPATDYGISPVTDAGTYKHLSQEQCYTETACQGNPRMELTTVGQGHNPKGQRTTLDNSVARVLEAITDTLTRPAKSSAIPSLTKEGTYKHLTQEQCYTETACQGFSPRKNPRMELTTVGQGHNPKRQRTTLDYSGVAD